MTAVIGVDGLCPPLCTYNQLKDGSISLFDIEMYHWALDELIKSRKNQGKA
jgi:hypothetical protein